MKDIYLKKEILGLIHLPVSMILIIAIFCFTQTSIAEELLRSDKSWDGGDIYYPEGEAEITSAILRLDDGETTRFHCHPVPALGYILKGNIEIETMDGKKNLFKKGEAAIEVMKTLHKGTAIGGPVEIIAFYAGAKTVPITVYLEDEAADKYCN